MHIPDPLPLAVKATPFDDPEWIFEIKHDGFRALAVIERGQCRFISRNKHKLYGLRDLAAAIEGEEPSFVSSLHHGCEDSPSVMIWYGQFSVQYRRLSIDLASDGSSEVAKTVQLMLVA